MLTFDRDFARLLLEICRFTYAAQNDDVQNKADKQDSLNWIRAKGGLSTKEPMVVSNGSTSVACISPYADKNIVSYMGTKTQFDNIQDSIASGKDWTQNLEANLVPFSLTREEMGDGYPVNVDVKNLGGKVHEGFLEELRAVQPEVIENLLKLGGRSRPLYITGHSQGGAEAALATRAFIAGGFPVVATYTFAAPRPGDMVFVKSVPATLPVHRIEFGDDIVPHVPPATFGAEAKKIVDGMMHIPFLADETKRLLQQILRVSDDEAYVGLGALCYGSNKTKALRVDLSAQEEAALFYDRLWSLVRHPEHWGDHHHLAGTKDEVSKGLKGNYTALVSNFQIVS